MADFITGRSSRIIIGRQDADAGLAFVPDTITAGAAAAANATTITVAALGAGVVIHAGAYLTFRNLTTGARKLAQVTARAIAAGTSLTVAPLDEAIENGDVALWPPVLGQRTSVEIGGQGNRVTSFPFEQDGYEDGFNATISNSCNMQGNYALQDAGYALARYYFSNSQECRLRVEFPPEKPGATKVRVIEGRYSITNLPLTAPSDQIITSAIEGSFNGRPIEGYQVPLAY